MREWGFIKRNEKNERQVKKNNQEQEGNDRKIEKKMGLKTNKSETNRIRE